MFKHLLLCLLSASIFSCSSLLKDPEVKITTVDVANITAKDITLNLKLNIVNPNVIPLNLDKVTYALDFSGKPVTSGMIDQGVSIPANGQGDVVVPLKFSYNMLDSLLSGFIKKTLTKEYELKGSAQLGALNIPFSKKGEIDLQKK